MSRGSMPLTDELLEAHGAALRRLARSLLEDPQAAEDAVQETWVRALESPSRAERQWRGWLEAVLRNVVRRRWRDRERRARREARAARPEAQPAASELVARQQTLRSLTDAVLALETGLQELVFLRYFEGLPPRRIAARVELPVEVVHQRLRRARVRLRGRLEARFRDDPRGWRGALAALCGVSVPTAGAAAAAGGMVMLAKNKLLIGAALVLGGLVAFGATHDGGVAESGDRAAADPAAVGGPVQRADVAGEEPRAARRSASAGGPLPVEERLPFAFSLDVHAIGLHDAPVPGARLWIGPAGHDLNETTAGPSGVAHLQWRGRRARMAVVLAVPADPSRGRLLRRIVVDAGVHRTLAVRVDRGGSPARGSFVLSETSDRRQEGTSVSLSFSYSAPGREPLEVDEQGWAWFRQAAEASRVATPDLAGKQGNGSEVFPAMMTEEIFEFTTTEDSFFAESGAPGSTRTGALEQEPPARVRGHVRDARGRPVEGARVHGSASSGGPAVAHTRTAKDGSFVLELPEGVWHLRAGGGDLGRAHHEIAVAPGDERHWEAWLDRGLELSGQLVDAGNRPLAGWRIELEPVAGTAAWIDGTVTDGEGRFRVPNVPAGDYRARIWPPDAVLPVEEAGPLRPGRDHGVVVAVPDPGALSLRPVDRTSGVAVDRAGLRLWRESFGVAVDDAQKGLLTAHHLPPGAYRVLVGGRLRGWQEAGTVAVTPGGRAELGEVPLTAPVVLHRGPGKGDPWALERTDGPVPLRCPELPPDAAVSVPPGSYDVAGAGTIEVDEGPYHLVLEDGNGPPRAVPR